MDHTSNQEARKKLQKEIYLSLGGGMIDLELDPDHYELAIDKALDRYRTRSQNSTYESFVFLEVQPDTSQYTLPQEVIEVRKAFRRGIGTATSGSGAMIDPFSLAATNTLYAIPQGATGGLATYDFAMQYQELTNRMFGMEVTFTWDKFSKKITFHRKFIGKETIGVWAYSYRPDAALLGSEDSRQWIRDYSIAACKYMLGEARSLYAQIAGPQGGTSLNGDALKSDASAEMERLEREVAAQMEGGPEGYGFIIG